MAIDIAFPGLPIPRRAMIGAKETLDLLGKRTVRRTLGGRAVPLQPAYGRRYRITLSNSGDLVWLPATDQLRTGTWLEYWALTWMSAYIPPNQTTVTLERDTYRVAVRDSLEATTLLPFTQAGRVITLSAPRPRPTTVYYRPKFQVVVVECDGLSADATGRSQGWKLVLEERA